jgi:hypothetical protein
MEQDEPISVPLPMWQGDQATESSPKSIRVPVNVASVGIESLILRVRVLS